jgi:hypothetical protein
VTTFAPLEGSTHSVLLAAFIEQLRTEKGGSYSPQRLVYAGDTLQERELIEQCLVEDSTDVQKEFPYSEFLCSLHKLIRSK